MWSEAEKFSFNRLFNNFGHPKNTRRGLDLRARKSGAPYTFGFTANGGAFAK
jgi:hypothetical protein